MDKVKLAGLAALLVALLTGAWGALKSCGVDEPGADGGPPVVVDAGEQPPPPPPPPPPADAGSVVDGGVAQVPTGDGGVFVSTYYAGWFPDMLPHDRIDFSSMTHLLVGRAAPTATGGVVQMLDSDPARGRARALDLCQRAHAAQRKCVLMLGGMGDGPAFRASSAPSLRGAFVSAILAFLDAMQADGVDLDWEEEIDYPAFLELAKALRAARPGMVLTVPVFPVNTNFGLDGPVAAFVGAVHPYVDQLNAMTYGIGMAGPWGGWVSWHTGALHGAAGSHPTSVSSTLEAYHAAGAPKAKLGMGIGFYGINYGPPVTAPLQNPTGDYQADDVEWRYSQLVAGGYLSTASCSSQWDDVAKMSYRSCPGGFDPGSAWSNAGFLSYEDERSIAEKGAWARANGYGGSIIWVLNYDRLPASGPGPLTAAVRRAFLE
jgi:chitinase